MEAKEVDLSNPMTMPMIAIPVSDFSRDISVTAYDCPLWIEDDNHVWITYVDGNLNVILADGEMVDNWIDNWRLTTIDINNLDDAHNLPCIGIDPLGHIHVIWNLHNDELNYKRSTAIGDPTTLIGSTMSGTPIQSVTYPRFHCAGNDFYFFCRSGGSGNGDIYVKRLNLFTGEWEDFATPLLSGSALNPTDNAYLGSIWMSDSGDIYLVWTCRIGWYNEGLYFARYDRQSNLWARSDGEPYSLPITRETADPIIKPGSASDQSITNSGHGIALSPDGTIHVVYHRYPKGCREVFHARYDSTTGDWLETQISDLRVPRLNGCPGGPIDDRPRPCHMELQGPVLIAHQSGAITVLYTRATSMSRGVWARPGGITYRADSLDNGRTWTHSELSLPVNAWGSEFPRESNGKPYVVWQEASQITMQGEIESNRNISIVKVEPMGDPPVVSLSTNKSLDLGPVYLHPTPLYGSITIAATVQPAHNCAHIMPLIDKGGLQGQREYRVALYGASLGSGFKYYADRVQVLLGNELGGWGLLWYPQVAIAPGLITDVVVEWDGKTVTMSINGEVIDSIAYTGHILSTSSSLLIGSMMLSTGFVDPVNVYKGALSIDVYKGHSSQ